MHSAIASTLRSSGSVFAEDEARVLIETFASPEALVIAVDQRRTGIPLQYIVGWADFYDLRVSVEPGVFVPRLRSEFLVQHALGLCHTDSIVVDLCCGSGALGMAIIANRPQIKLFASDNDSLAITCATKNLAPFGGQVLQGDLFDALPSSLMGTIEVLVANAPYVPTDAIELMPRDAREHEPRQTLEGGLDGLDVHRRIAKEARQWLSPGGSVLVETSEDQSVIMQRIFESSGLFANVMTSEDYEATVVIGTKL